MIILGIDPGWDRCGWAKVDSARKTAPQRIISYGLITTPRSDKKHERLLSLHTELVRVIAKEPKPDVLALEEVHLPPKGLRISNLLGVGEARGVIMLAAAAHGLDIINMHPLRVKAAITAKARASKQEVLRFLRCMAPALDTRMMDDTADALAIALAACMQCDVSGAAKVTSANMSRWQVVGR
ncbi:MAG: crossover junction endodeoxyribonuclease RuvC [Elusimicrobiota bacterium]